MTSTAKGQLGPELTHERQPIAAFYNAGDAPNDLTATIEDDVQVVRDTHGRFSASEEHRLRDRVAEGISRAAQTAQKSAKLTRARAQDGARSTVQAAREHPAMTAAVIGGLAATAAYAGARLFKARQDRHEPQTTPGAPLRKAVQRAVAVPKKA
jgi:ElaB/YqjD/DUF883 family membrane-anchored ribosome-binding protein